ncbi:DNA polymerase [Pseudomonas phage vB_PsaM_M1]|nr:DNA polymerase [Pseudomonas phage vB_PsaM_M1]
MDNGFVLDLEADGFIFESTKIWSLCLTDLDDQTKKLKLNPFMDDKAKEKFTNWLKSYEGVPKVVFHNGLGYDIFVLLNLLEIEFTVGKDTLCGIHVQYIDTYYLSMFLNPDRPGHSVDYFGSILGLEKIDWRQEAIDLGLITSDSPKGSEFMQYHPQMDIYCDRDTDVNLLIYKQLKKEWADVYQKPFEITDAFRCGQKSFFLMSCQELTGWKFDVAAAQELTVRIEGMMEEIRAEVEPKLPPRELKKGEQKEYTMPAKPFKKDGSFSANWEKFVAKHNGKQVEDKWEFHGELYDVVGGQILNVKLPMQMANQDQMKDWFLEQGWQPSLYNYQKDSNGKPIRDQKGKLIPTSPKIQEAQKICPNLMKLEGDIVKQVVKWLSLRNRLSVLQGWLGNERLQMDGRIGAGRTGIASTHRQKHKVVVNVPKASEKVLLGKEFRSLWTSEDGYAIAAGDAAALEGRVQGHYTWRYDGGEAARELLDGDVHSKTAKSVYTNELKDFDITSPEFNKDDTVFKPYRDRSKNIYYAAMYGAGDAKIASTAGLPEKRGKEISEKFWAANEGTKKLKDQLEKYWTSKGQSKYLPAIDGRMLCTRKKSALLNTIFQSCGGIAMDYACCFLDIWLGGLKWKDRKPYYLYKGHVVRRIGYVHDEVEFECEDVIAEEVAKLIERAIVKAGEHLKLNVELAGEGKIGKNWKEVH